jgi:hypothetical protein
VKQFACDARRKTNALLRTGRLWAWGGAALAIGVILAALSAAFVSVAEERNNFCTSCHLRPEQTLTTEKVLVFYVLDVLF